MATFHVTMWSLYVVITNRNKNLKDHTEQTSNCNLFISQTIHLNTSYILHLKQFIKTKDNHSAGYTRQKKCLHNKVVIIMVCGQQTSTSMRFCDSSSLCVSVATCWWHCDTLSSAATSSWERPVWSLAMARSCWSIVRCCLGILMSKCEQHN